MFTPLRQLVVFVPRSADIPSALALILAHVDHGAIQARATMRFAILTITSTLWSLCYPKWSVLDTMPVNGRTHCLYQPSMKWRVSLRQLGPLVVPAEFAPALPGGVDHGGLEDGALHPRRLGAALAKQDAVASAPSASAAVAERAEGVARAVEGR